MAILASWLMGSRCGCDRGRLAPGRFALTTAALLLLSEAVRVGAADAPVAFNRDIRPILADHCFTCHGPDSAQRKAKLRLDTEAGATADHDGRRPIVPGNLELSELIQRVTAEDPEQRMPPARGGRPLSKQQVDTLKTWVEQGARWESHWALIPPQAAAAPSVKGRNWVRNAIDPFILARLEREDLSPSPEADRPTLIRRVTLDLTGRPPTLDEVDSFLDDPSPLAYEKVVDRLLASPRYGEHMAVAWLEAARYADTNGYQSDGERFMWRWRDWVISALNRNMSFDQFTIEQLAGDLLPNPTLEQLIATGFNRNHRGNAEGGVIPEEYAVEYVADRVETTATVWMGLTVGCARCHDHKFDPITQTDYYRVFAFFNNVPENGRAVKFGNSPPIIKAPTAEQRAQLAELDARLALAERRFNALATELARTQSDWERASGGHHQEDAPLATDPLARFTLDANDTTLDGRFRGGEPAFKPGRLGQAIVCDGSRFVDGGDVGGFGFDDAFSLGAWVQPADERGGTVLSRMTDSARGDGYALVLEGGRIQFNLVKRWLDDALRVETERTLEPGRWHHILATYDGTRGADSVKLYVDGRPEKLRILLDELNQSFKTSESLRIGGGNGPEGRFHGLIDEVRVDKGVRDSAAAEVIATPETVAEIVAIPATDRTSGQARKLRAVFLASAAPEALRSSWRKVDELRRERERVIKAFPTTMVMREMPQPRPTFRLIRGQYDQHGERVTTAVPGCLPPLAADVAPDRLALARWLVSPEHPLTARVAVNRVWQGIFGVGLIKTAEDFGTRGEAPSHPELLDWLAVELPRSGWDIKALHRLIVTSATYRQSSRSTADLRLRDPENRLLARGSRLRLPAGVIRDQALAASGLLVERLGGPSVKPYQPAGLWRELAEVKDYVQDQGPNLYRRSLYTFWKRTVAPPSMVAFDASTRETCNVRESRTNTPLQALTLLNDVTFTEAARVLAQRSIREAAPTAAERIIHMFRLVTARRPRPDELQVLISSHGAYIGHYQMDLDAARLLIQAGESRKSERSDPAELAALMVVADVILNLDETITRE